LRALAPEVRLFPEGYGLQRVCENPEEKQEVSCGPTVDGNYVLAAVATGVIASAIVASTVH
jgi:hypothetical protein